MVLFWTNLVSKISTKEPKKHHIQCQIFKFNTSFGWVFTVHCKIFVEFTIVLSYIDQPSDQSTKQNIFLIQRQLPVFWLDFSTNNNNESWIIKSHILLSVHIKIWWLRLPQYLYLYCFGELIETKLKVRNHVQAKTKLYLSYDF